MNRDEIIAMARDAGFTANCGHTDRNGTHHPAINALNASVPVEWLERFAALVEAKERWSRAHLVASRSRGIFDMGVEPIGHLYCGGCDIWAELADWEIVADHRQCDKLNEHYGALGKEAKLPIYTTPQPTQAQAGAVPLTRQQLREAFYNDTACTLGGDVDFAEKVCRVVEKAHGIKQGGQRGTE